MTIFMFLLTVAYFVVGLVQLGGVYVPFEVFAWGGLILILGWWGHDAIHERQARRVVA